MTQDERTYGIHGVDGTFGSAREERRRRQAGQEFRLPLQERHLDCEYRGEAKQTCSKS